MVMALASVISDGRDFGEQVRNDIQAMEREHAHRSAVQRAPENVVALQPGRLVGCPDPQRLDPQRREIPRQAGEDHQRRQTDIDDVAGFPIDEQANDSVREGGNQQNAAVMKQRTYETEIDPVGVALNVSFAMKSHA